MIQMGTPVVRFTRKLGDPHYRDENGKLLLLKARCRPCPWHAGGYDRCAWDEDIEVMDFGEFWVPFRVLTR